MPKKNKKIIEPVIEEPEPEPVVEPEPEPVVEPEPEPVVEPEPEPVVEPEPEPVVEPEPEPVVEPEPEPVVSPGERGCRLTPRFKLIKPVIPSNDSRIIANRYLTGAINGGGVCHCEISNC